MLPQKRNPDAAELARGKCARVVGHYVGLLTALKGLPLSYNKDLQEDKEPVFDAVDNLLLILIVFRAMVATMTIDRAGASARLDGGFLEAISVADYLTRKGVPFREAHRITGAIVREAENRGVSLPELPLEAYRALASEFDEKLFEAISHQGALADKTVVGGTAPERVREEVARWQAAIEDWKKQDGVKEA